LWAEHTRGAEGLRETMQQAVRLMQRTPLRHRPIIDPDESRLMSLLNANNYQKGSWVLHSLRGLVGDTVFFAGIQAYYAAHRHGSVLSRDFATVMEKASGTSLDWYFRQALTQPGYPILDVTSRPVDGGLEVRIIQVQESAWGNFRIPGLQIRINGTLHQIDLDSRDVTRVLPVDRADGTTLEVDPFGWWLLDVRVAGGR
ncbi:MAG: M1 family aminopeptidase, partial [Gemmatimonadota bacterium]